MDNTSTWGIEGTIIITKVDGFSDLPDPATVDGKYYFVRSSEGKVLFGYRPAGIYYSNGFIWNKVEAPPKGVEAPPKGVSCPIILTMPPPAPDQDDVPIWTESTNPCYVFNGLLVYYPTKENTTDQDCPNGKLMVNGECRAFTVPARSRFVVIGRFDKQWNGHYQQGKVILDDAVEIDTLLKGPHYEIVLRSHPRSCGGGYIYDYVSTRPIDLRLGDRLEIVK